MDAYFLPWHETARINVKRVFQHLALPVKKDQVRFPGIDRPGEADIAESNLTFVPSIPERSLRSDHFQAVAEMVAKILVGTRHGISLEIILIAREPLCLEQVSSERSGLPRVYGAVYRGEVQLAVGMDHAECRVVVADEAVDCVYRVGAYGVGHAVPEEFPLYGHVLAFSVQLIELGILLGGPVKECASVSSAGKGAVIEKADAPHVQNAGARRSLGGCAVPHAAHHSAAALRKHLQRGIQDGSHGLGVSVQSSRVAVEFAPQSNPAGLKRVDYVDVLPDYGRELFDVGEYTLERGTVVRPVKAFVREAEDELHSVPSGTVKT